MTAPGTLACQSVGCPATYTARATASLTRWSATLSGWGLVGDYILCPEHAGRKRTRAPSPLKPLEGQLDLWGEAPQTDLTAPRKNRRGRAVN